MKMLPAFVILLTCIAFGSCSKHGATPDHGAIDFTRDVAPLLKTNCLICHHSETLLGGLNLESRKTAFGGRAGGAFLVPGEPESSLIYRVTEDPHGKDALGLDKMPMMEGVTLTADEREILHRWIAQGAVWPGGEKGWLKPIKMDGAES